eukprot:2691411-Prymnesium_polylepis.1
MVPHPELPLDSRPVNAYGPPPIVKSNLTLYPPRISFTSTFGVARHARHADVVPSASSVIRVTKGFQPPCRTVTSSLETTVSFGTTTCGPQQQPIRPHRTTHGSEVHWPGRYGFTSTFPVFITQPRQTSGSYQVHTTPRRTASLLLQRNDIMCRRSQPDTNSAGPDVSR